MRSFTTCQVLHKTDKAKSMYFPGLCEFIQVSGQLVSVGLNNSHCFKKWVQSPTWESSVYITDRRSTEAMVLYSVKFHKVLPLLSFPLSL